MDDQYRNTTPEEFRPAVPPEPRPLLDYRRATLSKHRIVSVRQADPDRFTVSVSGAESYICLNLSRADFEALADLLLRASEDLAPAEPAPAKAPPPHPIAPVGVASHSSIYGFGRRV